MLRLSSKKCGCILSNQTDMLETKFFVNLSLSLMENSPVTEHWHILYCTITILRKDDSHISYVALHSVCVSFRLLHLEISSTLKFSKNGVALEAGGLLSCPSESLLS